jgi:hypothetical protein
VVGATLFDRVGRVSLSLLISRQGTERAANRFDCVDCSQFSVVPARRTATETGCLHCCSTLHRTFAQSAQTCHMTNSRSFNYPATS